MECLEVERLIYFSAKWVHEMETFSGLLDLCEGNPLVTAGFLHKRPVMRTFDVGFFDDSRTSS